jgi:hypothetical protein
MRATITSPLRAAARLVLVALTVWAASSAWAKTPFDSWKLLDGVTITEVVENNVWIAKKNFPAELVAAAEGFTIQGYYLPIDAQGYVSSFLLIRDPDECPFCGTSYGPSLEVTLKRPLIDREPYSRITLTGALELIDDPETFMAYRLVDAAPLD